MLQLANVSADMKLTLSLLTVRLKIAEMNVDVLVDLLDIVSACTYLTKCLHIPDGLNTAML